MVAVFEADWVDRFQRQGYAVFEGVVESADLQLLGSALGRIDERGSRQGGVRGVLAKCPELRPFAERGLPYELARAALGSGARPVKATLFDKTPEANWKVPWHQDLSIAVAERHEIDGFGPWTVKDGIHHVQPPAAILEGMLAIRIHLDPAGPESGALRVVPESHRQGRLTQAELTRLRQERGEAMCPVGAGGVMLMAPLLLHASSASLSPGHRRVLHIEYAAQELPPGLRWAAV
jgi:hypothetical protein